MSDQHSPIYQLTPAALAWLADKHPTVAAPRLYALYTQWSGFGGLLKLTDMESREAVIYPFPEKLTIRVDTTLSAAEYKALQRDVFNRAINRQQMEGAGMPAEEIERVMWNQYAFLRLRYNLPAVIDKVDKQADRLKYLTGLRDEIAAFVVGDTSHGDHLEDVICATDVFDLLNDLLSRPVAEPTPATTPNLFERVMDTYFSEESDLIRQYERARLDCLAELTKMKAGDPLRPVYGGAIDNYSQAIADVESKIGRGFVNLWRHATSR